MTKKPSSLINHLIKSKKRLRRGLAAMPIEEKVKMLVAMQKMSNQIRISCGRKPLPEWQL
ncbi:MAG: hypothetical protein HY401_00545 [Elusimicrobia bacterium]|nr:hypothetical protein [Elusimicrobiota bacterium]